MVKFLLVDTEVFAHYLIYEAPVLLTLHCLLPFCCYHCTPQEEPHLHYEPSYILVYSHLSHHITSEI